MTPAPAGQAGVSPAAFWMTVFLPFSAGAFLSNLFRSVNAVIAPNLTSDLGVGPELLGLITASYFVTFSCFQIPLGILLDRYGPRLVQAGLLPLAALGSALFAVSESTLLLTVGRGLIGLGVCGAVLASFKAIALWYPPQRTAFVNGLFMAAGSAGALAATTPVEMALSVTDWRGVYWVLAVATLVSAAWIWLASPSAGGSSGTRATGVRPWAGLGVVYRDRLFWRLAPLCAVSNATNLALQSLWAGPWLAERAGLERAAVAEHLFALGLALTLGFFLVGGIADLAGRFGISLFALIAVGLAVNQIAQLGLVLELTHLALPILVVIGLLGQVGSLGFALLARHFPPELAGRGLTALSFMIFFGAFLLQYGVGAVIELWPVAPGGGYPAAAYGTAFGAILLLQVAALAWFLLSWWRSGEATQTIALSD